MRENLSSLKLCGSDITLRIIRFNLLEVTTKSRAIRDHLSLPFNPTLAPSLALSVCVSDNYHFDGSYDYRSYRMGETVYARGISRCERSLATSLKVEDTIGERD